MALQDDIMALLSQVGDAGDRATSREALGRKLYAEMGDRLSGDALRAALRDVESARGPMGEMEDYSRVADILEKYMQDAAEPLPDTAAAMPMPRPDIPSPDTAAAMPMPRPDIPSPDTASIIPQPLEPLPPMPGAGPGEAGLLMVDDTGAAMQGQGMDEIREEIISKFPQLQEVMAQDIVDGAQSDTERAAKRQQAAIRMMEDQARQEGVYGTQGARLRAAAGEETGLRGALLNARMGREATPEDEVSAILDSLVYGGAPIGGIAAVSSGVLSRLAMRLGIGRFSPQQIARNPQLRLQIEQEVRLLLPKPTAGAPSSYVAPLAQVGAQGRQAAQAAARARQAAAARARQAARGERSGQPINIEPSPAQRLGSTRGSGSEFDELINRSGAIGMAGGMSVRDKILKTYGGM